MGGGVSLGSFCGSSMTETVKLLILFGGYKKVEIDAFSGASAGSLSLAIMIRYLACLPQEMVKAAVKAMLDGLKIEGTEFKVNDEVLFQAAKDYVAAFDDYAKTAKSESFDTDAMNKAKAGFLHGNPKGVKWFPDQWLQVLCDRARCRLIKQLKSLKKAGFTLTCNQGSEGNFLRVHKPNTDVDITISNAQLQDALAVQVVQEVSRLIYLYTFTARLTAFS